MLHQRYLHAAGGSVPARFDFIISGVGVLNPSALSQKAFLTPHLERLASSAGACMAMPMPLEDIREVILQGISG